MFCILVRHDVFLSTKPRRRMR